ncbi:hypothetical protein [Pseudomonas aeruginosa]|uniref:hypothetical protein n=1 Tax=Pseudomonas aeruginosa TaxID=287 RepID=UPI00135F967E|nr:hypothetical protein [Pseudomonas aeruginosa]MWW03286.1 hypothetical protein [Pseudomonas aeruginosa]
MTKWLIVAVGVLCAALLILWLRLDVVSMQRDQAQKAASDAVAKLILNDLTVTQYVDRIQYVEQAARTIVKEIPVYVTPEADASCDVSGFVRLHNYAIDRLAAGPADEAAKGTAKGPK